jgi:copper chaperone CopZ
MVGDMNAHGRIASSTPGRLRLRMYHPKSHPELMRRVKTYLNGRPGIQHVDANHATGSVTIQYDTAKHSHDSVLAMLHDIGVIMRNVMVSGGYCLSDTNQCSFAVQITNAISDLDRHIFQATGGKIDLKLIIPLALGALGIRQILREGVRISDVPGCVLLWYAVEVFYRLHQEQQKT